ncbi:MAG: tetratricopeptide repeat protein [Thermoplasmata archaeon]
MSIFRSIKRAFRRGKAEIHSRKGDEYQEAGELEKAEEEYRKSLDIDPDDEVTHYFLANLLKDTGRQAEAEKEYLEAIRLNPKYASALNDLGALYHRQGEYDKAMEKYKEAIKCDPNYTYARLNLATLLRDRGAFDEAEIELKAILKLPNLDEKTRERVIKQLDESEGEDLLSINSVASTSSTSVSAQSYDANNTESIQEIKEVYPTEKVDYTSQEYSPQDTTTQNYDENAKTQDYVDEYSPPPNPFEQAKKIERSGNESIVEQKQTEKEYFHVPPLENAIKNIEPNMENPESIGIEKPSQQDDTSKHEGTSKPEEIKSEENKGSSKNSFQ